MNLALINRIVTEYLDSFGTHPKCLVHAPGRINLIGEHTDYNAGFVLPGAVSYGIYFAAGRSADTSNNWCALDASDMVSIEKNAMHQRRYDWADYLLGACHYLTGDVDDISPFNCAFSADLPQGSGMSSSSALTCATLLALQHLTGPPQPPVELALKAHYAEHQYIGLKGGVMDQFACMLGRPGQLILIDCQDNTYQYHVLDPELNIFLLHSNVRRELSNSEYNTRAGECRQAVEILGAHYDVQSLRDVTNAHLDACKSRMPETLYRRAHYVVAENQRVLDAVDCIAQNAWDQLGDLINASHDGLRTEFEVSCPQLDFLQRQAVEAPWIFGSRMMGGGFGGCTINIARRQPDQTFLTKLSQSYQEKFGLILTYIPVSLCGGARILDAS